MGNSAVSGAACGQPRLHTRPLPLLRPRRLRADVHKLVDKVQHHSERLRQFELLVENIPGVIAYMDIVQPDNPGTSIPVYISPQVEDLLGYPREAWMTEDELWLK